jgi:hypothetical protein
VKKTPKQSPGKVERRPAKAALDPYSELLSGGVSLIEEARIAAIRAVNVVLTSTYWLVGQRIIEHEQSGLERAGYGEALLKRLAQDLTTRLGRGFSERNLRQMRLFYLGWSIPQTVSAELVEAGIRQTPSAKSVTGPRFPLPWSHYVRLLSVSDAKAQEYYEREALLGGWSARQLDRQIAGLAYQRTRGARSRSTIEETLPADAHVRDPFVLEFLNLRDEYSETELENALIRSIEQFLLELGNDFAFVPDKSGCASEPNGIVSIWFSSTAGFGLSSSWI